jgi:hypothetical protein
MKTVNHHIEMRKKAFADHEFFTRLQRDEPLVRVLPFARELTFWVMGFQDALRINTALITDVALKRIARHHLSEDSGHDRWFLEDLLLIDGTVPDTDELFGRPHQTTREMTYSLLAESYRARVDIERIVLLMTYESSGQVFFPKIVEYFKRSGVESALKYFAQTHLDVEKNHEIVEQQMQDTLNAIELPELTRERCIRAVDRCYDAFSRLFDHLEKTIEEATPADTMRALVRGQQLKSLATVMGEPTGGIASLRRRGGVSPGSAAKHSGRVSP